MEIETFMTVSSYFAEKKAGTGAKILANFFQNPTFWAKSPFKLFAWPKFSLPLNNKKSSSS
jgi:hypothetical protein